MQNNTGESTYQIGKDVMVKLVGLVDLSGATVAAGVIALWGAGSHWRI